VAEPKSRTAGVLTPLVLRIMQALWDAGPGTVAAVQQRLGGDLAYTTVQTMLNVLLRKKKVARAAVGRAFEYSAAVSRERAVGAAVKDLVARMFGGSSEALVMALLDARQITPEALERAAKLAAAGDEEEAK